MQDTDSIVELMSGEQERIAGEFEQIDGEARFTAKPWTRDGLGGGVAMVLCDGKVFERAGVVRSLIRGERVPDGIAGARPDLAGRPFLATGLSMILHPVNPYAPSFHANFRYFEVGGNRVDWWFGGGADMTPSYGFDEDAVHFHGTLKEVCDRFDPRWYPDWKRRCDEYFHLRHRGEMRGVGGIFFDYLTVEGEAGRRRCASFVEEGLRALVPAYAPIVLRRSTTDYGERERRWQLLRRGRYVEFNLVYDKGTLFGLQTGGNVESIFTSMPPLASWEFDVRPEEGSREADLARFLQPRDWVGECHERSA